MNQHDPEGPDVVPCQSLSTKLIAYVNRSITSYHLLISDKDCTLKTAECFVASDPCGPHSFPLKISMLRLGIYYYIAK